MAKTKAKDLEGAFENAENNASKKFKTYKSEGFEQFEAGEVIEGVLVSIRDHTLPDTRSKIKGATKEVRVYNIRKTDDTMIRLAGRTMLDRMADDIMDEHGGFTVDENKRYSGPGYTWFCNRHVQFIRGEDERTNAGNSLGSYEIAVEE